MNYSTPNPCGGQALKINNANKVEGEGGAYYSSNCKKRTIFKIREGRNGP